MFGEAFALVLHAWTEPETFGWEGRNYRFRTISAFPRPVQQPHPPIVSSAQTAEAATWIGSEGHMLGIFAPTVAPVRAAEVVSAYNAARDAAGNPAGADEVLYRARVYVAETDAQAKADVAEHDIGNMGRTLAPSQQRAKAAASVSAALFGGPPADAGHARERSNSEPEFHGSPESVIAQIRESTATIGWGFLDAIFTAPGLPFEKARRSLELFGTEVLPQLTR